MIVNLRHAANLNAFVLAVDTRSPAYVRNDTNSPTAMSSVERVYAARHGPRRGIYRCGISMLERGDWTYSYQ